MNQTFCSVELRTDKEVVLARQQARHVAELLGFEAQDQVRIATAVSELARMAWRYGTGGRVDFTFIPEQRPLLSITISESGNRDWRAGLEPDRSAPEPRALALSNARRLMDELSVESANGLTVVKLTKRLPPGKGVDVTSLRSLQEQLAQACSQDLLEEVQRQNQELVETLDELHRKQQEILQLNRELEETNRGVVALYAELDERADYLRKASELKSQFLSNMTHEFRTPLNSILSLSRLLLDRVDGELNAEQEKQVEFIRKAAKDLSDLVNDLLDLAKVEAGKEVVRAATFLVEDLFSVLRGTTRPLLAPDSPLNLVFEDTSHLPAVRTDERKLSQILRNFISNALKYTQQGEIRVSAALRGRNEMIFSVKDTGMGIPIQEQEKVFQEFYQVDSPVQRRSKGTGLGLPLAQRLAELLGGRVVLESEPGVGSTFSVILPLEYRGPAELIKSPESRRSKEVLIIDDDEISRYLLKGMLGNYRVSTAEAGDGRTGLMMARDLKPVAIFLDIVLPELNGFEVLEALKADPQTRSVPVILYSTKVLTAEEQERIGQSAVAVLSKSEAERDKTQAQIQRIMEQVLNKVE